MLSLGFGLRHLLRHWRMNSVILLGILMGTIFAACSPLLASVIAGGSLSQDLADATPATRNLEIRARDVPERIMPVLQDGLRDLLVSRMKIGQATIEGDFTILVGGSEPRRANEVLYFRLWSFDNLDEVSEMLAGRSPQPGWAESSNLWSHHAYIHHPQTPPWAGGCGVVQEGD